MSPGQWKNLAKTLHAYSERNEETKFWEIRFYARHNGRVYGDATELRYAEDFEELLQVLAEDEASLEHILPDDELRDIKHHRRAIMRYRQRWFTIKAVDADGKNTWIKNADAMKWSKRLEYAAKGQISNKEDVIDLIRKKVNTAVQTIQKTYGAVTKVHAEVESSGGSILAVAKAIAADPKLDKTPKPILSESGIDEREPKKPQLNQTTKRP